MKYYAIVFSLLSLLFLATDSLAGQGWMNRDELFTACGQDPDDWCLSLLVKKCGAAVTPKSIVCARRNADQIAVKFALHTDCVNRFCEKERSTPYGAGEAKKCFKQADKMCK